MASSYPNQCVFERKTPEYRANSGKKPNLEPASINFGINHLTIMLCCVKLESIGLNFESRTAFSPVNTRKTRRNNRWHVQ
jgi:hypothetical protein